MTDPADTLPPFTALEAWRLALPLVRPYKLSFGPVAVFDTVFVRATLDDGRCGWGEATLLTGYTDETIDDTWACLTHLLQMLRDTTVPERTARLGGLLAAFDGRRPFLATALRTAFEMAQGSALLRPHAAGPLRVPILGLLQGDTPHALTAEAQALIDSGYTTLKVKVGLGDARTDARTVQWAQHAVAGRATLRLDANQGYSVAQAIEFVRLVDPVGIELFEQPCAAGDWAAHAAVAEVARDRGLPLMLDESIYSLHEIERTAREGSAAFVKVKLMKFESLARLDAALARIAELGLRPVLGNGVANELGCWMEACVATRHLSNAGEMNGFLKPRQRLFTEPLALRDGAIELAPGTTPQMDVDRLQRHALAEARCD